MPAWRKRCRQIDALQSGFRRLSAGLGFCCSREKPFSPKGPADALRQGIAMVHQHFSLVPKISAIENLMLGRARAVLESPRSSYEWRFSSGNTGWRSIPIRHRRSLGRRAPAGGDHQMPSGRSAASGARRADRRLAARRDRGAVVDLPPADAQRKSVILVTYKLAEIAKWRTERRCSVRDDLSRR